MSLINRQQSAQFEELGYFVTEPMWTTNELGKVTGEINRLHAKAIEDAVAISRDVKTIEQIRYRAFIGQAHLSSPLLCGFVSSPIYLEACAKFIGPDADLYYNQVVIKPPGKGRGFGWHQDSGYTQTQPLAYITCWTAISRTFIDNGCIWVVPGSHKQGLVEHQYNDDVREHWVDVDESQAVAVQMQPGQVAIFSSLMLHKSGPNISDQVRQAYVPQYHVPEAIKTDTGKPFGDQYPVLRRGRPCQDERASS